VDVTLRDVARLAGVSPRSVSNVVNGQPHVSEDISRRVRAAVVELGYQPNPVAQLLRASRTTHASFLTLTLEQDDPGARRAAVAELLGLARRLGWRATTPPDSSTHPTALIFALDETGQDGQAVEP